MSEQETIKLVLQNINKENIITSINKNAPQEAIVLLLHFFMHQEGFRCIGTEESAAPVELPEGKKIPQEWNKSNDVYSFKYKHWQSSMTFLLKVVKLGKQLLIHALAVEDGKPVMLEMNIADFVDEQKLSSLLSGSTEVKFEDCIKDIQKLESLFRINISRKLVPFLNKEGYEESAPSSSSTTSSTASSQSQQQRREPVQPMYVPPEYEDPLRIGPVRAPQRSPLQEDDYGFGVGSSDLYPQITPPMYIGGRGGFGGSGGMMMGPRHPAFTGGVPQPGRGLPPGVPPGARFDPFGPPGTGAGGTFPSGGRGRGGQGNFGPTPDHQRPPRDFDDDFGYI